MTATSTLDDRTTDAIRQALGAASRGLLAEACQIGERALASGGDVIALNAMLGMLRCQSGQIDAGIDHLHIAHRARPTDQRIAINLANSLAGAGRHQEALGVLTAELAASDKTRQLLKLRGYLAQNVGDTAVAIAAYEQAVSADPSDWESWNNLGNARRSAGDAAGAVEALYRASTLSPHTAPVRLNYATALEYAARFEDAEREYRRMAADFPTDANPLRELFQLLRTQYRDDDALEAIVEAVRREPANIELGIGLASYRLTRQQHAAAEEAYRHLLTIDPGNKFAYLGIATVLDLTNRTDELAALVGEAEEANVEADGLSFVKAFHLRRDKRFAEGLEELRHVPDDLETARRQQLLGQLREGAGDYDGAFEAYERMNETARQDPSEPEQRAAGYRQLIKRQCETLTPEWVATWQDANMDERPSPAFLVGFPRSGTTLLDTILMSHPSTEVLEEEPTLMRATEALGGFEAIATASAE